MSEKLQRLLGQVRNCGIYHLPHSDRNRIRRSAQQLGYACLQADLCGQGDVPAALHQLGTDLSLPDWYGANFDALSDCLTDLGWQEAPGYVLLITGADDLCAADADGFATLNDVFSGVVESWREQGVPFWVFYDLRADGLATLPTLAPA